MGATIPSLASMANTATRFFKPMTATSRGVHHSPFSTAKSTRQTRSFMPSLPQVFNAPPPPSAPTLSQFVPPPNPRSSWTYSSPGSISEKRRAEAMVKLPDNDWYVYTNRASTIKDQLEGTRILSSVLELVKTLTADQVSQALGKKIDEQEFNLEFTPEDPEAAAYKVAVASELVKQIWDEKTLDDADNFVHKRDLEAQNRSLYPSDEEWDLDPNGTHLSRSSGPYMREGIEISRNGTVQPVNTSRPSILQQYNGLKQNYFGDSKAPRERIISNFSNALQELMYDVHRQWSDAAFTSDDERGNIQTEVETIRKKLVARLDASLDIMRESARDLSYPSKFARRRDPYYHRLTGTNIIPSLPSVALSA